MHETGSARGPICWKPAKSALERLVVSSPPIFLDLSIHCVAAMPIPCTSFFRVSYGTTNLWRANPLVAKVCCQGPPPSIYLIVSFPPISSFFNLSARQLLSYNRTNPSPICYPAPWPVLVALPPALACQAATIRHARASRREPRSHYPPTSLVVAPAGLPPTEHPT